MCSLDKDPIEVPYSSLIPIYMHIYVHTIYTYIHMSACSVHGEFGPWLIKGAPVDLQCCSPLSWLWPLDRLPQLDVGEQCRNWRCQKQPSGPEYTCIKYVHVYLRPHVNVCVNKYVYTFTYTYTDSFIQIYFYVYICACVHTYNICICKYTYIYMYISGWT